MVSLLSEQYTQNVEDGRFNRISDYGKRTDEDIRILGMSAFCPL